MANSYKVTRPIEAIKTDNANHKENRALQTKRSDDTLSNKNIGLYDHDEVIKYFIENVILPRVEENGIAINVPVIFGGPDKWKSIQKDGFFRDQKNKLMVPLIMYRRLGHEKNREKGRNLIPSNPQVFKTFSSRYSERNNYDQFSALSNAKPQMEFLNVVIPDYITISYECIIWTDYISQMNKIIEAISYAESSYWGNDRFKFFAAVPSFDQTVEVQEGQDRAVKTSCNISVHGYIISDSIQKEIAEKSAKSFSLNRVELSFNVNENTYNMPAGGLTTEDILHSDLLISSVYSYSTSILDYLKLSITRKADVITSNSAIFSGQSFARSPFPLPSTNKNDFNFYLNGQFMDPQGINFSETGDNIIMTFDPQLFNYTINPATDEVEVVGKFKA